MIELNGIQISDNNINTKKNVKIYVDEKQLDSKVGELQDLETINKSSVVNAINEIKNTTDTLQVDVNRIYSDFTIIPNTPTEQEFTYKKSNEGIIEKGVAVIDKVKGNSVVWNQQCKVVSGSFSTSNLSVVASEDSVLVNGTASQITVLSSVTSCPIARVVGHKYLLKGCPSGGSNATYSFRYNSNGFGENGTGVIVTCVAAGTSVARDQMLETFVPVICITNGVECNNLLFRPRIIDLTQMFGAGNEPTTYEEFLQRKPNVADEYAYNEGTIVNNKVEKVVTTGRNLFDMSKISKDYRLNYGVPAANDARYISDYIPCVGSNICLRYGASYAFYDSDLNIISSENKSTTIFRNYPIPSGAKYARFDFVKADVEGKNNYIILGNYTEQNIPPYTPYQEHTLDLSWIKEIKDAEGVKLFEDGMRSARTAFDEVAKGRAIKRIEVVDLGTLNWRINGEGGDGFYCNERLIVYSGSVNVKPNILCGIYETKTLVELTNETKGISVLGTNKIWIKDSVFSDAQSFKAAMSGIMLYYELAEPIEVEYDEKSLTYPVVAGGTEQAIASEDSTPMRASITYGSNTVATILSLINRVNELERKITN